MLWILIGLFVLNAFTEGYLRGLRDEWINMQNWMIDQQKVLMASTDFLNEAMAANQHTTTLIQWIKQSFLFSNIVLAAAQFVIFWSIAVPFFSEDPYIPTGALALLEAAVIVFARMSWVRYYESRGMCAGIQANVEAVHILDNDMENNPDETEPGATDAGRDETPPRVDGRQDD